MTPSLAFEYAFNIVLGAGLALAVLAMAWGLLIGWTGHDD
jgi:hypothetical protein